MKKIYKLLVVIGILILGSQIFTEFINAEEKKKCVIEIEEKKETVTEEHIKGTISYPVLKPALGCKWEDFNKRIEDDIKTWKEDVFTIKDEYFKDYASNATPIFEMDSRYEIGLNKDGLISVYVDYYQYTGGAHGMTVRRSYNYDAEHGKFVQINQIFKDKYDYETVINKKIREEIQKKSEEK